jgi:hypothetical protein
VRSLETLDGDAGLQGVRNERVPGITDATGLRSKHDTIVHI